MCEAGIEIIKLFVESGGLLKGLTLEFPLESVEFRLKLSAARIGLTDSSILPEPLARENGHKYLTPNLRGTIIAVAIWDRWQRSLSLGERCTA